MLTPVLTEIDAIDAELEQLKAGIVTGEGIRSTRESITKHEKCIHLAFNSFKKHKHKPLAVLDLGQQTRESLDCLTKLCYEHLHLTGLSDVAELISSEGVSGIDGVVDVGWCQKRSQFISNMKADIDNFAIQNPKIFKILCEIKFCKLRLESDLAATQYLKTVHPTVPELREFIVDLCGQLVTKNEKDCHERMVQLECELNTACMNEFYALHGGKPDDTSLVKLVSQGSASMTRDTLILSTQVWQPTETLPIDAASSPHSVFVCPVLKEEFVSSEGIRLLPCRHMISSAAVKHLVNRQCPYCKQPYTDEMVNVNMV